MPKRALANKARTDATEQLTKALSLQPLDGTDVVLTPSTHTLKLYGKSIGKDGGKVAATVRMAYSAARGVTVKITARSEQEGLAPLVVSSVS
jgi:coatomer subunit gamma